MATFNLKEPMKGEQLLERIVPALKDLTDKKDLECTTAEAGRYLCDYRLAIHTYLNYTPTESNLEISVKSYVLFLQHNPTYPDHPDSKISGTDSYVRIEICPEKEYSSFEMSYSKEQGILVREKVDVEYPEKENHVLNNIAQVIFNALYGPKKEPEAKPKDPSTGGNVVY